MCKKCPDLDQAIQRYSRVIMLMTDPVIVSEAKKLLAEALKVKAALHPAP